MVSEAKTRIALTDIDSWIADRVVVTGSLPPEGGDIDLLARREEAKKIAAALMDRGFCNKEHQWVRFVGCDVEAFDLLSTESWDLPPAEERALFADALPIEDCSRVVRLAPHHVLLILARNIGRWGDDLTDKRRARIRQTLEDEPAAWDYAAAHAGAWRVSTALKELRIHYENGHPLPENVKSAARAELHGDKKVAVRPRVRGLLPRRRPVSTRMIAFSGIDGSGKSTQIEHLERALEKLGIEVETVWMRLVWTTLYHDRSLVVIARPFKAVLRMLSRFRSAETAPEREEILEDPNLVLDARDPAREVRERSLLVTRAWTTIITLIHVRSQRRAVREHLRRGKVVICDRYTLDAAVHLRFRYGARTRLRPQIALMHRLLPVPIRAYFVDVPPATALARRSDDYSHAHLEAYTSLYRALYPRLGVIRVDGERSEEDLCAEIAQDVWMSLEP